MEARGDANFDLVGGATDGDDFLSRERALLGDDADQFASANDKLATVEDGDDDLLGGGTSFQANVGGEEITGFESSFPAIDTTNEVRQLLRFIAFSDIKSLLGVPVKVKEGKDSGYRERGATHP